MTSYKKFLFSINLINILLLLVAIVFYSDSLFGAILVLMVFPRGTIIALPVFLMVALIATPPIFMCRRLIKNKNTNVDDKYLTIYILVNLICYSIPFIMYFVDLFGYLNSNAFVIGLVFAGIGILVLLFSALSSSVFAPKKVS